MVRKNVRVIVILVLLFGFSLYGIREKTEYRERFAPMGEKMMKSSAIKADSLNCTLVGGWFSGHCNAVFTVDTLAYIGDGGYLKILNVKDPSNPVLLGKVRTPSVVHDIYVQDTFAYVADSYDGLRIINVSDPNSPNEIGYYDTGDFAIGVYVQDTLAYVADYEDGLRIINVSDHSSPDEIGYYDTGDYAWSVYVQDTLAYVADDSDGLRIINVSDPTSPSEIGYYDTGAYAIGVYVQDTLAYVADGGDGLRIINVSNPSSPNEIGYYDTGDIARDVYVQDTLSYVADYSNGGLRIINVSDPTSPSEIGYYDTGSYARGVYVQDTLAYMADGYDGLYIIRYTGGAGVLEAIDIEKGVSVINVFSGIRINYSLKERESVKVEIYNILGQKVSSLVNTFQSSGKYSLQWNGKPGIYFVRITIGGKVYKEKGVLIK